MLEVRDLKKYFSGIKAVDNVCIDVRKNEIVGLIGPNGAGKTTLFNAVTGFTPTTGGKVAFEGFDITALKAHEVARKGIIRTFQTPWGFPRMTLLENMLVFLKGTDAGFWSALMRSKKVNTITADTKDKIIRVLETLALDKKRHDWVQDLSAGELKLMEIARALMAEPKIFLMDEPAAGINPAMQGTLIQLIRDLRMEGGTFLVVDHNLKFICDICDRIYVMSDGRLLCEGPPDRVVCDKSVIECYIGNN